MMMMMMMIVFIIIIIIIIQPAHQAADGQPAAVGYIF